MHSRCLYSRQETGGYLMSEPLLIARTPDTELFLLPGMANRHGLITGATGTG
ncbi:hypothetical protein AC35_2671 [Escherichia coli 3-475-03_S3_C2]|nr:hypothetical protein AC35_2671 [Escherichia coli 3-475-03_S3_C2]